MDVYQKNSGGQDFHFVDSTQFQILRSIGIELILVLSKMEKVE